MPDSRNYTVKGTPSVEQAMTSTVTQEKQTDGFYLEKTLLNKVEKYAEFEHGGNRSKAVEKLIQKGFAKIIQDEMTPGEHRAWIKHREKTGGGRTQ